MNDIQTVSATRAIRGTLKGHWLTNRRKRQIVAELLRVLPPILAATELPEGNRREIEKAWQENAARVGALAVQSPPRNVFEVGFRAGSKSVTK